MTKVIETLYLCDNIILTGWTIKHMLSALFDLQLNNVKIPLDAGNSSTIRSYLLALIPIKTVKMVMTRGQSAWAISSNNMVNINININKQNSPSETKCGTFGKRNTLNNYEWFQQWLVGVVDGDGCFILTKSNGKWSLYFKVEQSSYNLRLLYHIKSNLGVGSVYHHPNNNASYRLRNVKHIIEYLLPIFDKYSLLTSKCHSYYLFKQAAIILNNNRLTMSEKDRRLIRILSDKTLPSDYISHAWKHINSTTITRKDALSVMSKPWLVGFTEAEGSFYIASKDTTRFAHGFAITQKLDLIVLIAISLILNVPVVLNKTYNAVVTTDSTRINSLIKYYSNTMKGMKSLEFRIWARSFSKKRTEIKQFEYLSKVQKQIRNIRSIRLDKNFNLSHYRPIRSYKIKTCQR
jgi:hypothetical protein